ncbi:Protein phosphatase methylesterase 1 [Debaryomyces fabryi]|uniref:Protein phosphatase methylesterase 1 n=1 Tax=Debaryomyces fabryi TaxID=58627 RepID=A0A0V1PX53_9ASCO|nr:Protein phosphatase methylesterase 1 [Debaryomyces fabryi]KSA00543.1 Protein phosphatase methylesterase 1 [Debaryomyces fabryi]CUM57037.1 unnamed protein product [Debaryomyces fabryi]
MSDLHKQFLKKIKEQERAFGLSLLSEEPDELESDTSYFSPTPQPSNEPKAGIDQERNGNIRRIYNDTKRDVFPIADIYTDSRSGVRFQTYFKPPSSSSAPIFICHHGAGSSSMTFCRLAQSLANEFGKQNEYPGLFTYDIRGHGDSSTSMPPDYSLSSVTNDFKFIVDEFHARNAPKSSIYLLGHSLGGSVLTNYLAANPDNAYKLKGLIVLDIVEETAIKALSAMPQFIRKRPTSFNSYQEAIDWHIKDSHLLHNDESALISVPDLLRESPNGLIWKTNLQETEPFWVTWFAGLSDNFINCGKTQHVAKLLVLSGHETLDTNLIIGQMQGKYQLIVFNNTQNTGHFIQEDIPKQISISLIDFVRRNDSPDEYMKKEFGFVPKWGGKIHD